MKKLTAFGLALAMALGLLSGCGSSNSDSNTPSGDDASDAAAKTKLVVATSPDFPPFESLEGGEVVGIEVDILKKVAEKMGMELDLQQMDFDSVIPGVQAGKFDVGMSGITVTDKRKENVDFSSVYFMAAQAIVVTADSGITGKADLEGKKVSVQTGTTAEEYCMGNGYEVLAFTANNDAAAALTAGKVDAWVVDNEVALAMAPELGLTVLAVKPEDQDKLYGAIDLLAQATNTVARGEELKSAIEDNLLSLHEAIGDAEAPTVYMAGNSSVLQTAGPAMYQNYMIENAGGLNAAASVEDTYWAEVSYEQVLDWDPDYIILASDADYDVDSVLNDAALADCTAVREGHVYQLPHAIEAVDSPVPGSFLGSVYLGSVLHPEQVSEQFYHDCADAFYTTYYGFTPASYE